MCSSLLQLPSPSLTAAIVKSTSSPRVFFRGKFPSDISVGRWLRGLEVVTLGLVSRPRGEQLGDRWLLPKSFQVISFASVTYQRQVGPECVRSQARPSPAGRVRVTCTLLTLMKVNTGFRRCRWRPATAAADSSG
ncbi:hypothetical protein E2C01_003248 [Portunus trituberculatus]|uniref:Uncharacterized protein n=1 Tax=Portunus trituberculatus TaxID=210409 RepID=A0A5B7CPA0_PORTR|nr:hypothetical protein [Portunus trituberculatus]